MAYSFSRPTNLTSQSSFQRGRVKPLTGTNTISALNSNVGQVRRGRTALTGVSATVKPKAKVEEIKKKRKKKVLSKADLLLPAHQRSATRSLLGGS